MQGPDALIRGTLAHEVMERFIRGVSGDPARLTRAALLAEAQGVFAEGAPWPAARAMWLARVDRMAQTFLAAERRRHDTAQPVAFEAKGNLEWQDIGFRLHGRADRIDRGPDGRVTIYDYKTGSPPSEKEQRAFDKQLLIEAGMIEAGAFEDIGPSSVAAAVFIGLRDGRDVPAPLADEPPGEVLAKLKALILEYLSPDQGFTARRAMQKSDFPGSYDQLSRFGEWDVTTQPLREILA